jgi:hypothetical protein
MTKSKYTLRGLLSNAAAHSVGTTRAVVVAPPETALLTSHAAKFLAASLRSSEASVAVVQPGDVRVTEVELSASGRAERERMVSLAETSDLICLAGPMVCIRDTAKFLGAALTGKPVGLITAEIDGYAEAIAEACREELSLCGPIETLAVSCEYRFETLGRQASSTAAALLARC